MTRRSIIAIVLLGAIVWFLALWDQPRASKAPVQDTPQAVAPPAPAMAAGPERPSIANEPTAVAAEAPTTERHDIIQTERAATRVNAEEGIETTAMRHARARREHNAERYAFAQSRWDEEDVDADWAPQREGEFEQALKADGFNASPYRVECRETLCRVEATTRDNAAYALKGARTFMGEIGPHAASGTSGEGQDRVLIFFVPRDENTWPDQQ